MLDWSERPAQATFDLHGQTVSEAAANVESFSDRRRRPGPARSSGSLPDEVGPAGVRRSGPGSAPCFAGCASKAAWSGTMCWRRLRGAFSSGSRGDSRRRGRPCQASRTRPSTRLTEAVLLAALRTPGQAEHASAPHPLHHPLGALGSRVDAAVAMLDGLTPPVEQARVHRARQSDHAGRAVDRRDPQVDGAAELGDRVRSRDIR